MNLKWLLFLIVASIVLITGCIEEPPSIPSPSPTLTPTPTQTPPTIPTPAPTSSPIPEPTYIKIDSFDLAWEFDENVIAAEAKYEGQIIEVSGMITGFGKDVLGNPYLKLEGLDEYGFSDVVCYFPSGARSELAALQKYGEVVVRGECGYFAGHTNLKNCKLIQ